MRHDEYNEICRAVAAGKERLVQNIDLLYVGKVIACDQNRLNVESFGHRFEWDAARCRAAWPGTPPQGPTSSD